MYQMQDFSSGRIKAQEAAPEPYTLYNKEQAVPETGGKDGTLRDFEYFRSMYPQRVKNLQLIAEAVCDEVDYEESPMYDEYPDRIFVDKMFRRMQAQVQENTPEETINMTPEPAAQEMVEVYEVSSPVQPEYTSILTDDGVIPHVPYGPAVIIQTLDSRDKRYKTWEMNEGVLQTEQLMPPPPPPSRPPGPPPPSRPWGPPPPPPSRPWGPPPPPPSRPPGPPPPSRPWGPPPPSRPWGPPPPSRPWGPPPPSRPWGPPPPPSRPWGPPTPPRPGDRIDLDDILRLLLFGEMQRRRCQGRNCR